MDFSEFNDRLLEFLEPLSFQRITFEDRGSVQSVLYNRSNEIYLEIQWFLRDSDISIDMGRQWLYRLNEWPYYCVYPSYRLMIGYFGLKWNDVLNQDLYSSNGEFLKGPLAHLQDSIPLILDKYVTSDSETIEKESGFLEDMLAKNGKLFIPHNYNKT
jgi:hypothetical protein